MPANVDVLIANPVVTVDGVDVTSTASRSILSLDLADSGSADPNQLLINSGIFTINGPDLNNDGVIVVTAPGVLAFQDVQLGGTGLILLDGGALRDNGGTQNVLTQQAGHTIAGTGNLGSNSLGFINQAGGLVSADVSGGVLLVDPGAINGLINDGTLQAVDGGALLFTGSGNGSFDNTDGLILADGAGSEVQYQVNAAVTGGTLRNTNGGVHRVLASQNGFFNDVTIDAGTQLIVENNADAEFADGLVNQGTIVLNPGANTTSVGFNNELTLSGGGTIVLNVPVDGIGVATVGDLNGGAQTTTTNVDNTIRGQGNLGTNNIGFINQADGLVSADVSGGVLLLDPGATGGLANQGTLEAINGGVLRFTNNGGGSFDNTDGLILADGADSEAQYVANADITGGTLRGTNGGVHRVLASQNGFFNDVTIDTGTQLIVENNADAEFADGLVNRGTIIINPGASASQVGFNNELTLSGGGTIVLNAPVDGTGNATVGDLNAGTQTTTTNVDNTIRGQGNLGTNNIGFINQADGLVSADISGGVLLVDPGVTSGLTNQGTLEAINGGVLQLTNSGGGVFDNTGGLILADGAGSEAQYVANADVTGGTLRGTNGGVHRVLVSQNSFFNGVTIDTGTQLIVENNADAEFADSLVNQGTIVLNPGASASQVGFNNELTLSGGGTIVLNAPVDGAGNATVGDLNAGAQTTTTNVDNTIRGQGNLGTNNLGFINQADGRILSQGAGLTIDPGISAGLINQGLIRAEGTSTLTLSGNGGGGFDNQAGGVIDIEAGGSLSLSGTLTNRQGATFTQAGDFEIAAGGSFINESDSYSPGASTGTVNVTGTFTNDAAGDILFEINSETDFDQITGTGTFNLAGGIDIELNFTPDFYESIALILDTSSSSVNGTFTELLFDPIIGVGEALAITYEANAVLLTRALPGDANLNGQIEQGDLNAVLNNWGAFGNSWSDGDLDGSGQVEQGDLNLVLNNWGNQFVAPDFTGFTVPEPAAALGLLGLAGLRRRSRQRTLAACH
ncbi:MAG: hypothetical protein AAGE65_09020 [Planctomycetota bacterium]